jgi:DNA-directed RNA polymerase subunit RPC12/RpoP
MCSKLSPILEIMYCMFDCSIYRIVILTTGRRRNFLQMIFVYVCSTCSVLEIKTRLETWKARIEVNVVYWFHICYLVTVLALVIKLTGAPNRYQLSKSVIRFFNLQTIFAYTGWKPDSLQMMIFLYICSTCSVVFLKTQFETLIERNDVKGVYLLHFSYIITILFTCVNNWHHWPKSGILYVIGRSTDYLF